MSTTPGEAPAVPPSPPGYAAREARLVRLSVLLAGLSFLGLPFVLNLPILFGMFRVKPALVLGLGLLGLASLGLGILALRAVLGS